MASIRSKPNSRFWIACFTDGIGAQVQRSTKVPIGGTSAGDADRLAVQIGRLLGLDVKPSGAGPRTLDAREARRLAESIAQRFESAAGMARTSRLTEGAARKVVADIYESANREALPSSSVRDYFDAWLTRKGVETGEKTQDRYRVAVESFLASLGDRAKSDLAHLRSRDIAAWRDEQARIVTPSTANFGLKVIRAALAAARREGFVPENEATKVQTLRTKRADVRRPFTPAELRRLLDVADAEWRGMILTGLYTGARLGDVARLQWAGVDLLKGSIAFTATKTDRAMSIPVAPALRAHLEGLPAPDDPHAYLFPRAAECYERNYFNGLLSKQFRAMLVKAGLVEARTNRETGTGRRGVKHKTDELSFHALRHTFVSWLKDAGATDSVARDLAGHESADVNAIYTHLATETRAKAIGALPNILQ